MKTSAIAISIVLAFAVAGLAASVPALEEITPFGSADAQPCLIGDSGDCIVPLYCVTDPCPQYP